MDATPALVDVDVVEQGALDGDQPGAKELDQPGAKELVDGRHPRSSRC